MSSAAGGRAVNLLGRDEECETLDRLLADVRGGSSRSLVLRGEAGVGKSALLDYVRGRADGWRVLSANGVQSEMELAYSGLHQLCAPLLRHLDALPDPQRQALAMIFGLGSGPAPDRFLIGLATLTLLAETAEEQPLVCIVDDAQWLDQATAQTLSFVARRILVERVAFVCAVRTVTGDDILTGLPEMSLRGLGDTDARELLLSNVLGALDTAICDRIIAESRGNPLALLELPRGWNSAEIAGGFEVPTLDPVAAKIERSYLRRFQLLPEETRLLVLTAAAEPLGDPVLLGRATNMLGVDMDSAAPAVDAGLFRVRERVEFAHPLVRSATYFGATEADRFRAHRALADATDAGGDPDRRAWHRAHATSAPDEAVAAELERSAHRAHTRGGFAAAAAFLARATELTPDPSKRADRAVQAAGANVQAGAFDKARRLLAIAREGNLDESQQARIDLLAGQLALASSRGNEAATLLLGAARRLEPVDIDLARETYLYAFTAALFGARLNTDVATSDVARAATATLPARNSNPTTSDLLLDAFCALTDNYEAAATRCRETLRRLCSDKMPTPEDMRWFWHGTVLALELWDDGSARVLADRHIEVARATGALSELMLALSSGIPVLVFTGATAAAASAVVESDSVQRATGIAAAPYGALILGAWRGDKPNETKVLIDEAVQGARGRGEGIGITVSNYAHAVLCNGLGQYDEAAAAATQATEDPRELVAHNWSLVELVEAAVRTDQLDAATTAMERLTIKARASGTEWALGLEARSRALLDADDIAEDHYREAITHLTRTRVTPELARAYLVYGEWLRRTNRRTEARSQLNTAHELFRAHGLTAFAERARRELIATGASVRKRDQVAQDDLTPQEAQIARLARSGFSNSEIAAKLFLSARTVEWHLGKVFAKLAISSRRQLRDALAEQPVTE
jgi:DNA-binding CsgD family transcriptional regulator